MKEIKNINLFYRFHLVKDISIEQLYKTFKLKKNQFIHIQSIWKKFYLIFKNKENHKIYFIINKNKSIDLIENQKDVNLNKNASIIVFSYIIKLSSQKSEKAKQPKENNK